MPSTSRLIAGLLIFGSTPAYADAVLEYTVDQGHRTTVQTVNIRDGSVWIKGAGGDSRMDALYERSGERLTLIDHRKQRYTPISEDSVKRLTGQIEDATPLLRGLGDQIRKLNPKQRAKWEKLLGNVPLDAFEAAQHEWKDAKLQRAGQKHIAGIPCEAMQFRGSKAGDIEFCIAQPAMLGLPEQDAQTLEALTGFVHKLAQKAHGLASPFGLALAASDIDKLAGIPIQIRERQGKHPLSMTLSRAGTAKATTDGFKIPENYRPDTLKLW